jgi:hypothetical protein
VALCGALAVYGAEESLAALTREATAGIERALRDG